MSENRNVKSRPRPLSPHLQVYKPQLTSMLSITHRATGVALYIGVFALIYFLYSYTFWPTCDCAAWFKNSEIGIILGRVILFGYTFALFFHFCTGIRHLFWDIGRGYEIKTAYASGTAAISVALILTVASWLYVFYG